MQRNVLLVRKFDWKAAHTLHGGKKTTMFLSFSLRNDSKNVSCVSRTNIYFLKLTKIFQNVITILLIFGWRQAEAWTFFLCGRVEVNAQRWTPKRRRRESITGRGSIPEALQLGGGRYYKANASSKLLSLNHLHPQMLLRFKSSWCVILWQNFPSRKGLQIHFRKSQLASKILLMQEAKSEKRVPLH